MQPHKSRYWLNMMEKASVQFQKQVEAVCDCYLEAPELAKNHNTHTVSVDEMTGLQALLIQAAWDVKPHWESRCDDRKVDRPDSRSNAHKGFNFPAIIAVLQQRRRTRLILMISLPG